MKAGKLENINKKTELTGKKPLKIREMKIIQLDEFYEKKDKNSWKIFDELLIFFLSVSDP